MKLGPQWLERAKVAALNRLWTEDDFDLERGRTMREWEYDPVAPEPHGWSGGEFYTSRWWWSPPWHQSEPHIWGYELYKCGDEWCNDTLSINLPFMLGNVVIRYRRGPVRTFEDGPCDDAWYCMGAPPCSFCHHMHWPHCLPTMLVCPACFTEFPSAIYGAIKEWVGAIGEDSNYYCSAACAEKKGKK